MICLSCKRRPATMTADILVDGKLNTLKLCGLCAHRAQMQRTWDGKGWRAAEGKTHFTGDLSSPIPSGTSNVVFTAITKRGQRVMEWAESESIRFGVGGIASTAILISLLTEEGSASYEILREMGVDLDKAFLALNKALKEESSRDGGPYEQIDARSLLSEAQRRASDFNDAVVEPEHIMLALLDGEKSLALEILLRLGVNLKELKARLFYYLECQRMERDIRGQPAPIFRQMTPLEQVVGDAPSGGSILHFFARDLVQEARETNFDTSVGRDDLVERLVRVLCRERRNNPLLVGDSGVGKTYLVEALAKRVAGGDVPAPLREVSIAELDTVALMEGASMQGELAKRVIGQDRAIKVVSETVRRSRAGLSDQKHPIGTFLFMGSTGVGKTEVAKSLAEFLFDDERAMVRLDMSEFSEQHSVAKLIGSPPGYIGYEEGGQLTSAVCEKPYSVILLDEIEKAHPAVFNLLLQLMDEGRLTDSRGKTVNFRNTIVIMTSNIAGEMIGNLPALDTAPDASRSLDATSPIMQRIKEYFSMEFINRIDEIVVFNPLGEKEIGKIVELKVATVAKQMKAKDMALQLEESARALLASKGFSREFGARFLQRAIHKELSNPLSDLVLKGTAKRGDTVVVKVAGDSLNFEIKPSTS